MASANDANLFDVWASALAPQEPASSAMADMADMADTTDLPVWLADRRLREEGRLREGVPRDTLLDYDRYLNEHTYVWNGENFAVDSPPPRAPSPWDAPSQSTLWQPNLPPPPAPGYMDQASPFSLDSPPTETSFMSLYPSGNGTISFHNDNNEMESIRNVNVSLVTERCPVLGLAFEDSRSGPQLYLELLTPTTAIPFLRFLYTGTYALSGGPGAGVDIYDDAPTSVLSHCHLYRLGDVYDLPTLKTQAYVNVLRQCEFGCSSPNKPIDLCAAIRYIYKELREHANLIDALVHYCVSCFLTHSLAIDPGFKQLAYELRVFHQDLCQAVMGRDIENATAVAIIQMPFKTVTHAGLSVEDCDVIWEFHGDHEISSDVKSKKTESDAASDGMVIELPIRERPIPAKIQDQQASNDRETHLLGEKRAMPDNSNTASPVIGGLAHLLQAEATVQLVDAEYDVIRRPSLEEIPSNSDSESTGFVKIYKEDADLMQIGPMPDCTRQTTETPKEAAGSGGSDSESEWLMI